MHRTIASNVILIFIDGIGTGTRAGHNPFYVLNGEAAPLALFQDDFNSSRVIEIASQGLAMQTDVRLGIEGRPQSASNQTTILTGINIPRTLGFHKQGFPNRQMRDLIRQHSLFRQLEQQQLAPATFINAYPPKFFETPPRWISATTCAVEAAAIPFRTFDDLQNHEALIHDFTNQTLHPTFPHVPLHTPRQAADILLRIAHRHRFTLFEYFLTDRAGHAQDMTQALKIIRELSTFLRAVINRLDTARTTLIITSDHGNLEDLQIRNHTLNDVATLAYGRGRELVSERIRDLTHITPTIIELLKT